VAFASTRTELVPVRGLVSGRDLLLFDQSQDGSRVGATRRNRDAERASGATTIAPLECVKEGTVETISATSSPMIFPSRSGSRISVASSTGDQISSATSWE